MQSEKTQRMLQGTRMGVGPYESVMRPKKGPRIHIRESWTVKIHDMSDGVYDLRNVCS